MTKQFRSPSFNLNYLIKLLILCELLCLSTQSDVQYMKFYSDATCDDSNFNEEIRETNKELDITPGLGDALSIKVNGMWQFHEYEQELVTRQTLMWAVDSCDPKNTRLGPYTIAERFGDGNLNTSEIALCTGSTLKGIRFTVHHNEQGLTLPRQITMLSWFFTGIGEWTLYSNFDFTGEETCLKPREKVIADGHGVTHDWNSRLLVGSVRRGCTAETTTPTPADGSANVSAYANTIYFVLLMIVTFFHSI